MARFSSMEIRPWYFLIPLLVYQSQRWFGSVTCNRYKNDAKGRDQNVCFKPYAFLGMGFFVLRKEEYDYASREEEGTTTGRASTQGRVNHRRNEETSATGEAIDRGTASKRGNAIRHDKHKHRSIEKIGRRIWLCPKLGWWYGRERDHWSGKHQWTSRFTHEDSQSEGFIRYSPWKIQRRKPRQTRTRNWNSRTRTLLNQGRHR